MNALSWLIYAADVAGTLKVVAGATIFISGVTCGGAYLSRGFNGDMARIYADSRTMQDKATAYVAKRDAASKVFRPAMILAAVAAAVMIITPASSTLYAIAASEMGEEVLNSETGGKAVQALNAWLDRQIGYSTENGQ